MATEIREPRSTVNQPHLWKALENEPQTFEFFEAVLLLEKLLSDREPVGGFSDPSKEAVRFGMYPSFAFPASQIQDIEWPPDGPPKMIVNFMGMTGVVGVLPQVYTAMVIERGRARDHGLREFLDLFHHRMLSLFYRAWEKHTLVAMYRKRGRDHFTHHLMDLVGIGSKGLQQRMAVHDEAIAFYTGLLALQPRSAAALQQVLEDYFGVPVEVDQFVGGWYPLDPEVQCEMCEEEKLARQLGLGAVAGDAIWDHQAKARVRLGPLRFRQYRDFLPGENAYARVVDLLHFFSGRQIDFELQLILKREEVPECELGLEGEDALPLGWCSWAKTGPFDRDPDDAILQLGEQGWQ